MRLHAPQPLEESHSTAGFDCGDDSLNQWLQQQALGNQRSGATRALVVCCADGAVKAYVALTSGAVAMAASPGRFRRNMPDPIPVVVLARLAVCHSIQGQGIARALLADAFERVLMASEQIGVRGLVVHATSPAAREFYRHTGCNPSPSDHNVLLLRLVDIAATLRG